MLGSLAFAHLNKREKTMSDLDVYAFSIITDEKLTPDEKYKIIKEIFADSATIQGLTESGEDDLYSLNKEYKKIAHPGLKIDLTLASAAAYYGDSHLAVVMLLIEEGGFDASQPLHIAARGPHLALVRRLLALENLDFNYSVLGLTTESLLKRSHPKIYSANMQLREVTDLFSTAFPDAAKSESLGDAKESKEPKQGTEQLYIKVMTQFAVAWNTDHSSVLQYLAQCLANIHLKNKQEKDCPFLVLFTNEIFDILANEYGPDKAAEQEFIDGLLVAWQAYNTHENGFFKTAAELDQFLKPLFRKNLPSIRMQQNAIALDTKKAENRQLLDAKSPHQIAAATSSPIYAAVAFGSSAKEFKRTLAITSPEEQKSKPVRPATNYFEQFFTLSKDAQQALVKDFRVKSKGEGFQAYDIFCSVKAMAASFGFDNFTFAFTGPGEPGKNWVLHEQLLDPVMQRSAKYILFVPPSAGGGHALAGFIDTTEENEEIYIVDPAGNRYNDEKEIFQRVREARDTLEPLADYKIIHPSKYHNIPQSKDDNDCGIYTAIILFALLCKKAKITLQSANQELNQLFQSLDIDVANGHLPKDKYINDYLGALLLARENIDQAHLKQITHLFEQTSSMAAPSTTRKIR